MREKNAQDLEHVSLCGRKCLTTPKQGTLLMHVYSRDSGKCINEPKNKQTTKRNPALECVYHKQHDYRLQDVAWRTQSGYLSCYLLRITVTGKL